MNIDMSAARAAWWRELTGRGDPSRRPNLASEAFAAGWAAREGSLVGEADADRRAAPEGQEPGPLAGAPNKCHQARATMAAPTPQEPKP